MRVIAGQARGRKLSMPPGRGTRPSSDRTREGLFSALVANDGPLTGRRFLDLYAGSAAVAIEAWSRGAAHVLAVEHDQRAARVARENVTLVGARGAVVVRPSTVERAVSEPPAGGPYDVVFADPPYHLPAPKLSASLAALVENGWLRPGAVVVVERASRDEPFSWPAPIEPERSRSYGEGTLWYGRVGGAAVLAGDLDAGSEHDPADAPSALDDQEG